MGEFATGVEATRAKRQKHKHARPRMNDKKITRNYSVHWIGTSKSRSLAVLVQVGIQVPGWSSCCICHLGNTSKSRFESGFCLLCTSHGPCCLSPCHQVWEIWLYQILSGLCGGMWVHSWEEASHVQAFPRPNVTLSDFLPAKSERKKGNGSRNSFPAMSRRKSKRLSRRG